MRLSCESCADVFTLAARAKDALAAKTKAEEELRACVLQLDTATARARECEERGAREEAARECERRRARC